MLLSSFGLRTRHEATYETIGLIQLFVQQEQWIDILDFVGLGYIYAIIASVQREVVVLELVKFAFELNFELSQQKQAVCGHEDLEACPTDAEDCLRDFTN